MNKGFWTTGAILGMALLAAAAQATPMPGVVQVRAPGFGGLALAGSFYRVVGLEFRADVGITVSALGIYDDDLLVSSGEPADGLGFSHTLLIWNSSGTELARTTIGPGAGAPEIENFRYVDIAPIHFDAGDSFTVGVTYAPNDLDNFYVGVSPPYYVANPALDYLGLRQRFSSTPSYPSPAGSALYVTANFLFESDALPAPEPASLALFGLGLLGAGLLRRRVTPPESPASRR